MPLVAAMLMDMTDLAPLSPTPRTRLGRKKYRAATERTALYELLDEAMICHLGVVLDGSPVVLPTSYGRDGDTLYLHGSSGARSLLTAGTGIEVCVTVTLLDGIVYSRSVNNHSMNYRSAVIKGSAHTVTDPGDKMHGLHVLTDHLAPGSWEHAREVNAKEFAAVTVLALELAETSVKARTGEPGDEQEDVAGSSAWAGVLPVGTAFGTPIPATDLPSGTAVPQHIADRHGRQRYTAALSESDTSPVRGSR